MLPFLILAFADDLSAQHGPVGPEPGAARLALLSGTPVDLYTGIPDISVPLHRIDGSHWSFPLALRYHPALLGVASEAGDCGLGWSLQAGGVLTRTLYGLPDETPGTGYLFAEALLPPEDSLYQEEAWPYALKRLAASGRIDLEPDVFQVSAPGLSVRIVFDTDPRTGLMSPYTIPHSDLRITETYDQHGIASWTITDADGVTYRFGRDGAGRTARDVSFLTDDAGMRPVRYASAWHLLSVTAPGASDSVVFAYDTVQVECSMNRSEGKVIPLGSCMGWESQNTLHQAVVSHVLTGIVFRGGSVRFIRATPRQDVAGDGWELDSVRVFDEDGLSLRCFTLHQHYMVSPGCAAQDAYLCRRLVLDSVQVTARDGSRLPPWRFSYQAGTLPARHSKAIDHWGYYNGATQNTGLVPGLSSGPVNYQGADREAREQYMVYGVLTQVVNPLGGLTSFEWEAHRCKMAGGVTDLDLRTTPASIFLSGTHTGSSPLADTLIDSMVLVYAQQVDLLHQWSHAQALPLESYAIITRQDGSVAHTIHPTTPQAPFSLDAGAYAIRLVLALGESGQVSLSWQDLEVDTLTNTTQGSFLAGGLRIRTIRRFDGMEWLAPRSYAYLLPDGSPSGILLAGQPHYLRVFSQPVVQFNAGGSGSLPILSGECSYVRLSGSDLSARLAMGEPHVVYTRVVESFGDQGEFGSIERTYSASAAPRAAFYPYPPADGGYFARGTLLRTLSRGGDGLPRESTTLYHSPAFRDDEPARHGIRGVRVAWETESIGPAYDRFVIAPYEFVASRMRTDSSLSMLHPGPGSPALSYAKVMLYPGEDAFLPGELVERWPDGSGESTLFIRSKELLMGDTVSGSPVPTSTHPALAMMLDSLSLGCFSPVQAFIDSNDISQAEGLVGQAELAMAAALDSLELHRRCGQFTGLGVACPAGSSAEAARLLLRQHRNSALWGSFRFTRIGGVEYLREATVSDYGVFDGVPRQTDLGIAADSNFVRGSTSVLLSLDSAGALRCGVNLKTRQRITDYGCHGMATRTLRPGGVPTQYIYVDGSDLPRWTVTGNDSVLGLYLGSGTLSNWQYAGSPQPSPGSPGGYVVSTLLAPMSRTYLGPGRYRLLIRCEVGSQAYSVTFGPSVLRVDTLGIVGPSTAFLSVPFEAPVTGTLSISGDLLISELLLLPEASAYHYQSYDGEGRPRVVFGTGQPFRSYGYDALGRYLSTRDAAGRVRSEAHYQLTGHPLY